MPSTLTTAKKTITFGTNNRGEGGDPGGSRHRLQSLKASPSSFASKNRFEEKEILAEVEAKDRAAAGGRPANQRKTVKKDDVIMPPCLTVKFFLGVETTTMERDWLYFTMLAKLNCSIR